LRQSYADCTLPNTALYAFYSSVLRGITTDPVLMNVPVDDHAFHRGHAVFDTANVIRGKVYGLSPHLDRFIKSCEKARIRPFASKEQLRNIVLATVAAARQTGNAGIRYWAAAGRGDFSISTSALRESSFYCVVHSVDESKRERAKQTGIAEVIVSVPLKPPLLATTKTNNYLVNALTAMEAQDGGGHLGIQLDARGFLAEASIGSVAIVTADGVVRTPKLDIILRSVTLLRAHELVTRQTSAVVKAFEFGDVALHDAYASTEMLGFGGSHVSSIVKLDGRPIGNGKPGPVFAYVNALLEKDMREGDQLDVVPYERL